MLKCTRCRHVFPAPTAKAQASVPSPPTKSSPAGDESLTLPFDEPSWKDEPPTSPADDLTLSEPEEQYTLGTEESADDLVVPATVAPEPDTPPVQVRRDTTPRAVAPRAQTPRAQTPQPRAPIDDEEEDDEVEVDPDDMEAGDPIARGRATRGTASRGRASRGGAVAGDSERGTVWALMIFLAAVLASYGMLTRALFTSPQLCDRLLSRVPLIGSLGDERLLTRKVALSEITGSYQRIKEGKEVFVITGKALNTAPMALHGVQIAGKLFNREGHELDQKVIFCGNVISTKVLKDLTPREVSILQKLSPPKRFTIEPGESSTFVIVFMDPPREAVEFSTQVATAQRQT